MSKQTFVRTKPHVTIDNIGHVDHGKTTLVSAITKVLSMRGQTQRRLVDEMDNPPED